MTIWGIGKVFVVEFSIVLVNRKFNMIFGGIFIEMIKNMYYIYLLVLKNLYIYRFY